MRSLMFISANKYRWYRKEYKEEALDKKSHDNLSTSIRISFMRRPSWNEVLLHSLQCPD